MNKQNEIIIYQTEDGQTKLQVRLEDDTVWLNQEQIGALFEKSKAIISEHISNIFKERELQESSVVRSFRTGASDSKASLNKFGISEFAAYPTSFTISR